MRILHPIHHNLRLSAFEFSDFLVLSVLGQRSNHLLYVWAPHGSRMEWHLMYVYKSVSPLVL